MNKILTIVLGCFSVAAVAATPPAGSYQQSCWSIVWDGQNLSASCSNNTHAEPDVTQTAIKDTSFQVLNAAQPSNGHGNLMAAGITPGGQWYKSCFGSQYDVAMHMLFAACKGPDGIPHPSVIQATASQDVENLHGNLVISS